MRVIELGEQVMPHLLPILSEPDKFVIAHVLLTQLSGIEYQTFPKWNGLNVDIAPDGTATIDPNQRHELYRQWEKWLRTKPRPNILSPDK